MGLREIQAIKGMAHLQKESPSVKQKKSIAKRSIKMKGIMEMLKKLYSFYLRTRKECKIKSPVCTKLATTVNHTMGRTEDVILDQEFWEPSCDPCNLYIEENHAWARKNGHKKMRHGKK